MEEQVAVSVALEEGMADRERITEDGWRGDDRIWESVAEQTSESRGGRLDYEREKTSYTTEGGVRAEVGEEVRLCWWVAWMDKEDGGGNGLRCLEHVRKASRIRSV